MTKQVAQPSTDELLWLYRQMLLIREFEQTVLAMSAVGSAPRRRGSLVEEDSTQRVVD